MTTTNAHCYKLANCVQKLNFQKNSKFPDLNFRAILQLKNMIFENFKWKKLPENLNFRAKNRDFDQKQNYQKLKINEF